MTDTTDKMVAEFGNRPADFGNGQVERLLLKLQAERNEAAAENARLREALAPFAAAAEVVAETEPDNYGLDYPMFDVNGSTPLTLGDLRRARAALTATPSPQPTAAANFSGCSFVNSPQTSGVYVTDTPCAPQQTTAQSEDDGKDDAFELARRVVEHLAKDCEFIHTPRFVSEADFAKERGRFDEQTSDVPGFETELVDQRSGGTPSGDDWQGDMAYRLPNGWWFVIGYH